MEDLQRQNECRSPQLPGKGGRRRFSQSSELYRHLLDAVGRGGVERAGRRRRPRCARIMIPAAMTPPASSSSSRCQCRIASTENSPPRSKRANSSPASPSQRRIDGVAERRQDHADHDRRNEQLAAGRYGPDGVGGALRAVDQKHGSANFRPERPQIKDKATSPSRNVAVHGGEAS